MITADKLATSGFSVHDVSSVFKKYLIELQEPLTLSCYFNVIKKIAGGGGGEVGEGERRGEVGEGERRGEVGEGEGSGEVGEGEWRGSSW